jgi:hypothetical protein
MEENGLPRRIVMYFSQDLGGWDVFFGDNIDSLFRRAGRLRPHQYRVYENPSLENCRIVIEKALELNYREKEPHVNSAQGLFPDLVGMIKPSKRL